MERSDLARLAFDVVEPSDDVGCQNTPIILLHGMTSSRLTWNAISQDLANKTKRTVYRVDLRNHGDSEWKTDHNYSDMSKDVSNFMSEQKINSAVLLGHSMGGKTAMNLATKEPEKIEKLIIEDISPKKMGPSPRRFPFVYLKLLRDSLNVIPATSDLETAKQIAGKYLYDNTPAIHKSAPDRKPNSSSFPLQKDETGFSWKVNLDVLEKEFFRKENPKNDIVGQYDKPTLFIYGSISPYKVLEDKDLILNIFPQSVFHSVEGATHLVHLEYPREFSDAVIKFLQ